MIIHLENDLPVVVDLEEMPHLGDRMLKCTNVRTVDGKRPAFVQDRHATFLIPLQIVRVIEVPQEADGALAGSVEGEVPAPQTTPMPEPVVADEGAEEDLLARIRQI